MEAFPNLFLVQMGGMDHNLLDIQVDIDNYYHIYILVHIDNFVLLPFSIIIHIF